MQEKKLTFILADQYNRADDNGEALYRWIRSNKPEISLKFLLNRASKDWNRLKNDDFNLIDINDKQAMYDALNTADCFCFSFIPDYLSGYLLANKAIAKIFLNHGIFNRITNYIRYNKDLFDLMLVGNQFEYNILNKKYEINSSKLALTGLPRQDNLVNLNVIPRDTKDTILIYLWGRPWLMNSTEEEFKKSAFYTGVTKLLKSKRFKDICKNNNLNVMLKLHTMLDKWAYLFKDFKDVYLLSNEEYNLYEPYSRQFDLLLTDTDILITDYSTNIYDISTVNKPTIYFRPDFNELKDYLVTINESYFDSAEDGLAPVTENLTDLCGQLLNIIENNYTIGSLYQERINKQLVFKDNNCCQRAFDAIIPLATTTKDKRAELAKYETKIFKDRINLATNKPVKPQVFKMQIKQIKSVDKDTKPKCENLNVIVGKKVIHKSSK